MFSGLIQAVGAIAEVQPIAPTDTTSAWLAAGGVRLRVRWGKLDASDVSVGDSIAINGACMTVTSFDAEGFWVDVSAESLRCTCGLDAPGPAHLEKALRASDRLGGHIVSGHVDCTGEIVALVPTAESIEMQIRVPESLAPLVTPKGSLTVHGVSLTTNTVHDEPSGSAIVSINLIPHTQDETFLTRMAVGDRVNLEADLIARQVLRAMERLSFRKAV